jgi:hypothetical protein
MDNLFITFLLIIVGYCTLYFSGRKYLERFENRFHANGAPVESAKQIQARSPENAYSMDRSDTYDVSAVFNNQGSKQASKKQLSDAMTRYPLDWSAQGQGSQFFQENQEKYERDMKHSKKMRPSPYEEQSTDMLLPDASVLDDEEQKLLKTYKPQSSKGLLHYSMNDVKHLLDKVYAKKGLIPVIAKSKQGENIWEIVEVKEKNPKIVWEDETRTKMTDRGENIIEVPYTATDIQAGLDPFMQHKMKARVGRHDIKENSELDRMFTTSYPMKSWN